MKIRLMLVFIGALLLAGCMVGPKYVKPDTPAPSAFKEAPPDSFKMTDGSACRTSMLMPRFGLAYCNAIHLCRRLGRALMLSAPHR